MGNGLPPQSHDAPVGNVSQDPATAEDAIVRESSTYMTDPEAEKFCHTFADGLESGIGYARILDILQRQGFDKKTTSRLREALLERGDRLAGALARFGLLDPSARKLVLVAEQQGALPETFLQLSVIYGKRYKRKKAFLTSLVEPLVLVCLGAIVFRNIIGGNIVELTFASDTTAQMVDILIMSGIESAIFGLLCFSVAYAWLNLPVDFAARAVFMRVWLRIPFVSTPGRLYSISLFCDYLKQSIESGMTVHQGLELAAEACNHPAIFDNYELARERIQQGYSLARSLHAIRSLPAEVLEQVDIGEEAGRLDERLQKLAADFDEKAQVSFENWMGVYVWIMRYTIIVLVIGGIFFSITKLDIG